MVPCLQVLSKELGIQIGFGADASIVILSLNSDFSFQPDSQYISILIFAEVFWGPGCFHSCPGLLCRVLTFQGFEASET